jgi:hypothetical protein
MANSSIPHRPSLLKTNISKRSEMEALICQASGLAQVVIENDLFEYEAGNPVHKTLWLLCDLAIRAERLLVEPVV